MESSLGSVPGRASERAKAFSTNRSPKFFRYPVGLYSRVRLVRVPERREVANYALWLSGCCLAHEIAQRRFCGPCRSL
jgi:hypothetical protein